jgi:hypothetical protein
MLLSETYLISLSDFKTFAIFNISNFYELYIGISQRIKHVYGSCKNDDNDFC